MPSAIIVGQGAAGLTAALALAKEGIAVTSIAKTRSGTATCTLYAGGGFSLPVEGMHPDEHREMTYNTGRHMNVPELLEVFSTESPTIVKFLEKAKIPFRLRRGGLGLHRNPALPLLGGKALTDGLHSACLDAGVRFVHNMAAMRILVDDNGVTGVECADHSTGKTVTVASKAVILATGGGGALYRRTDNPPRITGDGFRLALDAGCHLMDMEFVQFYPTGFDVPGGAHWFMDASILDYARVTASDGREFLKEFMAEKGLRSGREVNRLARDMCSVAIALENQKGPCLLHTEDVPESVWYERFPEIPGVFPASRPPWKAPVFLGPIQHYFPGGVVIGSEGQTEIPGLFACGEVTGGVDGANRVGGNALTNCVLFGMRAAIAAARHVQADPVQPAVLPKMMSALEGADGVVNKPESTNAAKASLEPISDNMAAIDLPKNLTPNQWLDAWKSGNIAPGDLRDRLREISGRCLMPYRDGTMLAQAVSDIDSLRGLLDQQKVSNSRDLLAAIENLGLWYTAILVAKSALIRQESRGAHYRADFPNEDPRWRRHIYMHRRDSVLKPVLEAVESGPNT